MHTTKESTMNRFRSIAAAAVLGLSCLNAGPASAFCESEKQEVQRSNDAPECSGYYAKCWWPDRKAIEGVLNR